MARKLYRYRVIGSRPFPMDMLRHDTSYPRDSTAAAHIEQSFGDERPLREIELLTWQDRKHWQPTDGRWASFGWPVVMGSCEEVV